jgi:hypothetical protein
LEPGLQRTTITLDDDLILQEQELRHVDTNRRTCRPEARDRDLKAYGSGLTLFDIASNVSLIFVPSLLLAPIMATAINATISAYSTALAPVSSLRKRAKSFVMFSSPVFTHVTGWSSSSDKLAKGTTSNG